MKKFTDTQKKWALTATMIAALGCSVSFESQQYNIRSMEFASSSEAAVDRAEGKEKKLESAKVDLPTAAGMLNAKLIAMGDTTAVILTPEKNTEGKANFECVTCGKGPIIIDQPLMKSNIASISVTALAELEKIKDKIKPASDKAKDDKDDKDEKSERKSEKELEREERREEAKREKESYKDDKQVLKDALDDADCKSERNAEARQECITQTYLDVLSEEIDYTYIDRKGRTKHESRPLNSKAALEFYISKVEPGVKAGLKRSGGNSSLYQILADVSSDFNNVRERALSGTTSAFYELTVDYRNSIYRAQQTRNPQDQLKAQQQQVAVQNLYSTLSRNNSSALLEASGRGNIGYDEAQDMFESRYYNTASNIYEGSSKWLTLNPQGRIVANLNAFQLPTPVGGSLEGFELGQSLSNGRMDGVLIAPGYPGYEEQNRQGRPTTGPGSNSPVLTPPEMLQQRSASDGFEFGRPRSLSLDARAEADRRGLLQRQF